MSDEKKYTERDLVLAKREAWVACDAEYATEDHPLFKKMLRDSQAEAAARYPLPKVTRPRVVAEALQNREWRYVDGRLQWRSTDIISPLWHRAESDGVCVGMFLFPDRIRLLADLLANPTEECDADE